MTRPIQRALISVADKTGIIPFAQALAALDIEILSTGGTATLLRDNQIDVIDVSTVTGFPEMMNGRVKTLHPKIHGALLARLDTDAQELDAHDITPIDLVVVNLYPFAKTVANENCTLADAIENIDIGGPTLLRASAKNNHRVTVLTDKNDFNWVIDTIKKQSNTTTEQRLQLAQKAFAHTAQYDAMIENYLAKQCEITDLAFPSRLTLTFQKQEDLRYGENPHQQAAFYKEANITEACLANSEQHQGKPLSFNNIADSDAALNCVKQFTDSAACVIVKHANPCGVALADDIVAAYQRAHTTDSTSAFGGIIAFNQPLTANTAQAILDQQFVEVIIAPSVENDAMNILATKPNIRVLTTGPLNNTATKQWHYQRVTGGLLAQETDLADYNELRVVTERQPTDQELRDCKFAWGVAKYVKSNAIVYAKDNATIGIGAGQMSRVDSAKIAARKAKEAGMEVSGAVMASDAFFPFRDAIDTAAQAGITAIIQPGGSIRDDEVIQAANEANIAMILTGIRHFRH